MPRRKKKTKFLAPVNELGLPDPFPSAPTKLAAYGVKFIWPEYEKHMYLNFCELYAVKRVVNMIIGDEDWEWVKTKTKFVSRVAREYHIKVANGIEIYFSGGSDEADDIMEYEYRGREKEWRLPPGSYAQGINSFMNRKKSSEAAEHMPRAERKKAAKQRREKREGMVDMTELCKELEIVPRKGRAALRKAGIKKPDVGWAWPAGSEELDKARKAIQEAIN